MQTGAVHEEFYKDSDLTVGGEVNVWGRRVIITDCDDFTKNYYRSKYGIGKPVCFSIAIDVSAQNGTVVLEIQKLLPAPLVLNVG